MANYNVSTVYRGIDKASPVMDRMSRNAMKSSQKMKHYFNQAARATGRAALNVAKYGTAIAAGAAVYATKRAVGNYLEFESEMLNVKAITRSTAQEYDAMTKSAIKMASRSVFTSREVAQGMKYLGIAGWETKNIIAGMPGVLQLAAATQSELAMTSDMLSDSMTAFKIKAEEATHVADVFAGVTTTTNTTLEMLKESMKDAAPAASMFGISVEETSAILGMMANNGIKGSKAGTAFKNMVLRMASPVGKAKKWMKQLNIEVADSNGNFKNILDILDQTKKGLSKLSPEQQTIAKNAIFGKIALSGVNAVLADQDGKVRELAKRYKNDLGVAMGMAETQLSGASGALKKLTSAWDAFSTNAVREYAPALEKLFNRLNKFVSSDIKEASDFWANVFSDAPVGSGADLIQKQLENIRSGVKTDKIMSPIPFMSDRDFNSRLNKYKKLLNKFDKETAGKRYRRPHVGSKEEISHAGSKKEISIFENIIEAEKQGSKVRAERLLEKSKEIRSIYNYEPKLKNDEVKTPVKSFMEKITKQENTLIIKAPKGTVETEGKVPKYLKLVETF